MAAENKIEVQFGVKLDELFSGLNSAQSAVKTQTDAMKSSLEGLMSSVGAIGKGFALLAAIASGGKLFADALNSTKEITGAAKMMGKTLGITTTEASIFNVALGSVGGSTDQAKTAVMALTRTLGTSPEKFEKLGVATKDSTGAMRPMADIMLDVNGKFAKMADGTAKNLALAAMFGRQWMGIGPVLAMTAEGMEKARIHAESLNLVVGEENARDTLQFKKSMTGMQQVMQGLSKTVGEAIMPLLTELGEWFATLGPAAVSVTKYAIGGLVAALQGLKFVAVAVWEGLKTLLQGFGAGLAMMVDMADKAIHGDWAGARAAWTAGTGQIKDIAAANLKIVADEADKTANSINQLFSKQTATKAKGGSEAPDLSKDGKDTKDKSQMPEYDRINTAAKESYEMTHGMKLRALSEDVAYWERVVTVAQVANGDLAKAQAKLSHAKTAEMKQALEQGKAMSEEAVNEAEKEQLSAVDGVKRRYEAEAAFGKIGAQQMLTVEKDLEEQRHQIQMSAQQARITLLEQGPNTPAALQKEKDKLAEIERAYAAKVDGITLASIKQALEAGRASSEEAISRAEKTQLGAVESLKIRYETELALGSITQLKMLELEKDLEEQRLQIQTAAQQARIALAEQGPDNPIALQKEKDKLLEIEEAYALKVATLSKTTLIEQLKPRDEFLQSLSGGLNNVVNGMLTGSIKLRDGFGAAFKSMGQALASTAS